MQANVVVKPKNAIKKPKKQCDFFKWMVIVMYENFSDKLWKLHLAANFGLMSAPVVGHY